MVIVKMMLSITGLYLLFIAELEKIIDGDIDALWEKVGERSAVSFEIFSDYFKGCANGYAL
ncbi:MAG: hypothetical protein ACYCVD_06745 [Desulfitobacteriaceae bacterium]